MIFCYIWKFKTIEPIVPVENFFDNKFAILFYNLPILMTSQAGYTVKLTVNPQKILNT